MTTHYPKDDRHWVCRNMHTNQICEVEIAWPGSAAMTLLYNTGEVDYDPHGPYMKYASPEICLALKMSHRYLRNSPHFHKTRNDILWLRDNGVKLSPWLKDWWLPRREQETYRYEHPKLNQSKEGFFQDRYQYDHDSIHEAVALGAQPMYTFYSKPGAEVACDMSVFNRMHHYLKVRAVYEEAAVLAIERALVPHFDKWKSPEAAFEFALQKVATSITSGVFREFAWENFDEVLDLGKCQTFWGDFRRGLADGTVKETNDEFECGAIPIG